MSERIIEISQLSTILSASVVHENLDLTINRGEKIAIIGPSGCGKTTLMRTILMLLRPKAGSIKIFGTDITQCDAAAVTAVQNRWGVMFQGGALFSALSVLENVMFPMVTETKLSKSLMQKIALFKIALTGLKKEAALKYPSTLSGGMKKRAALARALVLDPELVFLDEPTAGLDPKSASEFDALLLQLHAALGLTVVMITHDLDTLWRVPDRVVFLGEGRVLSVSPMQALVRNTHPLIREYFDNVRAKQFTKLGVINGH